MQEIRDLASLRRAIQQWKAEGKRIGFVPTMGALHEGHLSLIRMARERCDKVAVSIFVNPTQFGPKEDFAKYPRTEAQDIALLLAEGCDLVWLPTVEQMYPEPDKADTQIIMDKLSSRRLCDRTRGVEHFIGVAMVVVKLFNQIQPDIAVFGEKDYQQLQIIRRLVADLDFPIEIIGAPIVRDWDGLALSSRNRYLDESERKIAPKLYATMKLIAQEVCEGKKTAYDASQSGFALLKAAGFSRIEYFGFYDIHTLNYMEDLLIPARLMAAAQLGKTRLIDNMSVIPAEMKITS